MKSISKGIALGLTSIVVAPIVLTKKEGVKGFFKGLAAGILGGCAIITSGVGVGKINSINNNLVIFD